MRNLFLLLAMTIMLTALSGCFENDHSHDDGGHSHDKTPQKHHSIDQ